MDVYGSNANLHGIIKKLNLTLSIIIFCQLKALAIKGAYSE